MKKILIAAAAAVALSSAQAEGGLSAKALFYGTDGSVMSVATSPGSAAPAAVAAKAQPKQAVARKPPSVLGAGYFIRLKKDDGSTQDVLASRIFHSGERFQLGVKVNRPSFVYIYNKDGSGQIAQLYPQPGQANFVDAMGVVFFPAQGSFQFDNAPGDEQLLVYVSPRELKQAQGLVASSAPDVILDPAMMPVRGSAPGCPVTTEAAGAARPDGVTAVAIADAGSSQLAGKGIQYAAADSSCGAAPKLASKAIVFADDPAPAAGGQVASYVVKHQATPSDGLHLQLKLVHQ